VSRPRPRTGGGVLVVLTLLVIVLFLLAVGALAVRTTQPRAMAAKIEAMEQAAPTRYEITASTPQPPVPTPIEQPAAQVTGTPPPYTFVTDADVLWREWKSGKRDGPYCPDCQRDHRGYLKMRFAANVSNKHGGLDEQWTCDHCSFTRTLPKTLLAKARP
jgi:hypothetical protein